METLRAELAETNIGVSVYCPRVVRSNGVDSNRNRPRGLGDVGVTPDQTMVARVKKVMQDPETAMDPLDAGQRVLRGMRSNDLYILTHPEYEGILRDRGEVLLASIPRDVQLTQTRQEISSQLRKSIYTTERDRKRCAQPKRAK